VPEAHADTVPLRLCGVDNKAGKSTAPLYQAEGLAAQKHSQSLQRTRRLRELASQSDKLKTE